MCFELSRVTPGDGFSMEWINSFLNKIKEPASAPITWGFPTGLNNLLVTLVRWIGQNTFWLQSHWYSMLHHCQPLISISFCCIEFKKNKPSSSGCSSLFCYRKMKPKHLSVSWGKLAKSLSDFIFPPLHIFSLRPAFLCSVCSKVWKKVSLWPSEIRHCEGKEKVQ